MSGEASHLAMEGSGWEVGQIHGEHMNQNQSLGKFECQAEEIIFRKSSVPFNSAAKVFAVNEQLAYLFLEKKIQAYDLIKNYQSFKWKRKHTKQRLK